MRHTSLSFLLVAGLLALTSCSGCDPKKEEGPTCGGTGATCTAATAVADCCSDYCDAGNHCAPPPTCGATGADCGIDADCCAAQGLTCESLKCGTFTCKGLNDPCQSPSDCCATTGLTCFQNLCKADTVCVAENNSCTAAGTPCCGGAFCDTASANPTNRCSTTACVEDQLPCSATQPCCGGSCDTTTNTCPTAEFCTKAGNPCTSGTQCCSGQCGGDGKCLLEVCKAIGEGCIGVDQCCSKTGTCEEGVTSGYCEAVPPGTKATDTCKTLGETCTVGTDCCSTNCVGGTCAPAYSCNATGDVCLLNGDCCSNSCDTSSPLSIAGRCLAGNGGCTQGGNPCDNASNCCTRRCEDPGSGVTVCRTAGGCRMTGDFCDSTDACCGGTADDLSPGGYGVVCQVSTSDPVARCDNGTGCNPPGNICGAACPPDLTAEECQKANASQNCCTPATWTGSGKPVCKPDAANIMRCFGAPNIPDVVILCPDGYDGTKPAPCCIDTGDVCQMRDQCCNLDPCVPDAAGVLRCTKAIESCLPAGSSCSAGSSPCCSPYGCVDGGEFGFICGETSTTPGCTPSGTAAANACTDDTAVLLRLLRPQRPLLDVPPRRRPVHRERGVLQRRLRRRHLPRRRLPPGRRELRRLRLLLL